MNPSWPGAFCLESYYQFSFFTSSQPIQTVYLFLCEFSQIAPFKQLVYFIQVTTFVSTELFIVFLYYPIDVRETCSKPLLSFLMLLTWVFFS